MTEHKTQISTKNAPTALGPYSQAIRVGDFVFLSGQLGLDPASGALVGATVAEQTARALDNLGAVLKEAGLNYADVVKTTVFLADMARFAEMNEVYAKYFKSPAPARSTVQAAALPKGGLVEIEAIAVRPLASGGRG